MIESPAVCACGWSAQAGVIDCGVDTGGSIEEQILHNFIPIPRALRSVWCDTLSTLIASTQLKLIRDHTLK